MIEDIIIPQIGETVEEEVIITKWRKREGERIKKGEVLLELEAGKGMIELESAYTGTLVQILVPENEITLSLKVVGKVQLE